MKKYRKNEIFIILTILLIQYIPPVFLYMAVRTQATMESFWFGLICGFFLFFMAILSFIAIFLTGIHFNLKRLLEGKK